MMRPFDYVSPATKLEAVHLLGARWGSTEVIAGGSDLLALMKADVIAPKRLVNIKNIDELHGVAMTREGLRIGALTRLTNLADDENVRRNYPALTEALMEAASPQIRNMATLGGNLCQRPRCWYFRNGFGLLPKDKSGKELVTEGQNRYHAILGNTGPAKFVSPSTIAPVLIAYGARIRMEGPTGQREVPLEKFYVIPKSESEREHDLHPNEIVTEVVIPSSRGVRVGYCEIRQKQAFDWPLAVAAVSVQMNDSRVQAARVVMGHVAPVPWISPEAEGLLIGRSVDEETARSASDAAVRHATPLSRNLYKVQLARIAVKRAILKAPSGGAV
jgi:xanthine dehydrogenase YagS FAD-binding subunit